METAVDFSIPAKDLTVEGVEGSVTLHPPFSDIGYCPIPVKLYSCHRREGQVSMYIIQIVLCWLCKVFTVLVCL